MTTTTAAAAKKIIKRVAKAQGIYTGPDYDDKSIFIIALIEHKNFRIQLGFKVIDGLLHAEVSGSDLSHMKFAESSVPMRGRQLRGQISRVAEKIGKSPFSMVRDANDFLDALTQ